MYMKHCVIFESACECKCDRLHVTEIRASVYRRDIECMESGIARNSFTLHCIFYSYSKNAKNKVYLGMSAVYLTGDKSRSRNEINITIFMIGIEPRRRHKSSSSKYHTIFRSDACS